MCFFGRLQLLISFSFLLVVIKGVQTFVALCLTTLSIFQEDVKEGLLINEELERNKERLRKMKGKRKNLFKEQQELEAKRGKLNEEVKDLEARVAAGRRGEELQVDVSIPDLLGDDSGIDDFLSPSFGEQNFIEKFDPSLFDDIPSQDAAII